MRLRTYLRLQKSSVRAPGSRGGLGYYDAFGEWHYGRAPRRRWHRNRHGDDVLLRPDEIEVDHYLDDHERSIHHPEHIPDSGTGAGGYRVKYAEHDLAKRVQRGHEHRVDHTRVMAHYLAWEKADAQGAPHTERSGRHQAYQQLKHEYEHKWGRRFEEPADYPVWPDNED